MADEGSDEGLASSRAEFYALFPSTSSMLGDEDSVVVTALQPCPGVDVESAKREIAVSSDKIPRRPHDVSARQQTEGSDLLSQEVQNLHIVSSPDRPAAGPSWVGTVGSSLTLPEEPLSDRPEDTDQLFPGPVEVILGHTDTTNLVNQPQNQTPSLSALKAAEQFHPGPLEATPQHLGPSADAETLSNSAAAVEVPQQNVASSSKGKQKGKQREKMVHFRLEPKEPSEAGPSRPHEFQPLQPGETGWESSPDRPPVKLPIRFKDAVGRQFVIPWEKAKTWESMERVIRSAFARVELLEAHIISGHYDVFSDMQLAPDSVPFGLVPGHIVPNLPALFGASSSTTTTATSSVSPSPSAPSSSTSGSPSSPTQDTVAEPTAIVTPPTQVVILKELWEELIVPGMLVYMQMWPMAPQQAPPPLPPPPQVPAPAPAAPMAGRGGVPPGVNHWLSPPRPPRIIYVDEVGTPRGKTRKRQNGL